MRVSRNPWDILGLPQSADLEQIKIAYKRAALKHHPDKGGNPEIFARISEAYDTLKNRKHIPVLTKPEVILVNLKLSIEQQINGINGIVETEKGDLDLKIPPGALKNDRFKIRCNGKNYIINIQELAHKDFTRQGNDVIMYLNLDIVTAMIGGEYSITAPDGELFKLMLHSGIQNNELIVIDKKGLFNRKTNKRGNLHIFINIDIPALTNENDISDIIDRLKKHE
jgi:DnaJ-class molecular chaperone